MRSAVKTADTASNSGHSLTRQARRKQLIEATIESISEHGISATTMGTVTGIAGLSVGLVNFHFSTKDNLFEETLRFLAEEHREQWKRSYEQAGLSPQEKLLAIVDAHYHQNICSRKKLAVWFGFYGEAKNRAKYRAIANEIDDERMTIASGLINQIIRDGDYTGVTARDVAFTLEGMYDGFCLSILMYPGEFSRKQAKTLIRNYLASVFPKHF